MSVEGERGRRGGARKGNIISHEPASDHSTVQNVLGFFQEYVPQVVTGPKGEKRERVVWAKFETGDINDVSMEHRWGWGGVEGGCGGGGGDGGHLPLLLVLGLTSGISIWMVPPGGDAREVYCCYGDGEAARTVCLLPSPEPGRREDQFASQRPIMAVVKKGRSTSGSVPYSSLHLLSLRGGGGDSLVKKIQFKGQPVMGVHANRRVVVVVLRKRIVVMDATSLNMRFYIKNNYPQLEYPPNPVALGQRWLAFAETKLSPKHRSAGGVSSSQAPSVATAVIKNVKKGLSALSETLSGLTGKGQQSSETSDTHPQSTDQSTANVVTVLDVDYDHPEEVSLHEAGRGEGGVVAHFQAHTGHGVHVAALSFNHSGTLLITACTEGHTFNVFHLVPHPWLSSETAVHHLYLLYRGATSASVQDVSFSWDSRWVAISTLNGTTHLFPIAPYGGEITVRTHASNWVVNKLSRFHTSAGIETISSQSHSNVTPSPVSTPPHIPTSHPPSHSTLSSSHEKEVTTAIPKPITWNNPRSLPLPIPATVTALHQIKQPYLSSSDGSGTVVGVASTTGSTPHLHGDPNDLWLSRPDIQCVRATFSSSPHGRERGSSESSGQSALYSLYVVGGSGVLTHYHMQPRPHEEAREGDDAPISLNCKPLICWRLLSKPHSATMKLPLSEENPLITASNEYRAFLEKKKGMGGGDGGGKASGRSEGEWLSQVEILTHAMPTRRLWMGPQFSFKTYHSPAVPLVPSSSSTDDPTTGDLISLSPDHTHPPKPRSLSAGSGGGEEEREGGGSAVLAPSHDTLLSDLFSQPPELSLQTIHTSPISMPTVTSSSSNEPGMESGPHSMEHGVLEVYGSWKKVAPQLEASQMVDVEKKLAEAIDDHQHSSHPSQPQVTTAARRSSQTKTGFHTPNDAL